jgi:hypothetical protein
VDEARLAERMGASNALALLPESAATPAERAIQKRLIENGRDAEAEPQVRGGGGAALASAGTLSILSGPQANAGVTAAPSPLQAATAATGRQPRDPGAVESAMAGAMGLDDLAQEQRSALRDMLVAGDCPSTALASLLGRAPVIATRDLVRNLENGC